MTKKKTPNKSTKKKNNNDIIDSMEIVTEAVRTGKLPRRKVRNLIFRIIQNKVWEKWMQPYAIGLATVIESQFKPVKIGGIRKIDGKIVDSEEVLMEWKNFTTVWDVHPEFPLQVITRKEWFHAGGKFDETIQKLSPTGFTQQGFD